jgi:hypothetical protein
MEKQRYLGLAVLMLSLAMGFAACGDEKPASKKDDSNAGAGGSGGSGGSGPGRDFVSVCKAAAKSTARAAICMNQDFGGDYHTRDVNAHPEEEAFQTFYAEKIAEVEEDCATESPQEYFECANYNLSAFEACSKKFEQANGCAAIAELENSEDCNAICSGSGEDNGFVSVCLSAARGLVRAAMCIQADPPDPRYRGYDVKEPPNDNDEAIQRGYEALVKEGEEMCRTMTPERYFRCENYNLKAYEACIKATDSVMGCNSITQIFLDNPNCKYCSN